MHICTCFQTGIRIGLRYGRSDLGTFNVYDEMDEIASFPSIFLLHGHGVFQKEEARLAHIYKSFLSFFMMSSILFNLFVHLRARFPHPTHLHRPCISDPESPKATSIYPLPCAIAQFLPLHAANPVHHLQRCGVPWYNLSPLRLQAQLFISPLRVICGQGKPLTSRGRQRLTDKSVPWLIR